MDYPVLLERVDQTPLSPAAGDTAGLLAVAQHEVRELTQRCFMLEDQISRLHDARAAVPPSRADSTLALIDGLEALVAQNSAWAEAFARACEVHRGCSTFIPNGLPGWSASLSSVIR